MNRTERVRRELLRRNPGLEIPKDNRGGHMKIFMNGRLIGILPRTLRAEGLSPNLISQLRRRGVVL